MESQAITLLPLAFHMRVDVSFSCVWPVTDHKFHHNIVKVAVDALGNV